ncbi:hypothetical protein IscW_ISCW002050 [Ixodes scapularis]|uniref:Secreted protein n=1 Tax=Ixodes scapularis TaxID=6945 RepID=B7P9T8_IXOSC|nr:hypothetical protein IscW_ISCW002050 [Ixodes scapularis]|eukprot:XP_002405400.1 hypothetical protein IscW_ISCW002050 [Ixodes scapularis]
MLISISLTLSCLMVMPNIHLLVGALTFSSASVGFPAPNRPPVVLTQFCSRQIHSPGLCALLTPATMLMTKRMHANQRSEWRTLRTNMAERGLQEVKTLFVKPPYKNRDKE